jgi:hypothetical protein
VRLNATLFFSGETVTVGFVINDGYERSKAGESVLKIDGVIIRYDE